MFDDSFKKMYKSVPIAVWSQKSGNIITKVHNHEEIEISMRVTGGCEVTLNDKKFVTKPGDILFKNPFEIHGAKTVSEPLGGHCICFDCSLIVDETVAEAFKSETIRIKNHIAADDANHGEIKRMFMNIIECYEKNGEYMLLEIKAHISILIAFLLEKGYVDTEYRKIGEETFNRKVFRYISQNYRKNITSKDVADLLSYNHSYFCRKFRQNFGRKFYDYLNMYRVFEAQKLFVNKEKTITQIAIECGFNSPTYFTKCFRQHTGMLPSEYNQRSGIETDGN